MKHSVCVQNFRKIRYFRVHRYQGTKEAKMEHPPPGRWLGIPPPAGLMKCSVYMYSSFSKYFFQTREHLLLHDNDTRSLKEFNSVCPDPCKSQPCRSKFGVIDENCTRPVGAMFTVRLFSVSF